MNNIVSENKDAVGLAALDKSPQTIRRLFDQIAPRYDLINHCLSLGIDYSWRRRAVETVLAELGPVSPIPVLDVCCGTGDFALAWNKKLATLPKAKPVEFPAESLGDPPANSRLFRDRNIVVGIDFSSAMLEIGRRKVRKNQADRDIVLWQGDALELPFEDQTFAAVSVGFGLRNVVDLRRGLSEMVRVAKPGGVVAVLDFDLPRLPFVAPLYRFYLTRFLPCLGKWISRNREGAYRYFSESILRFEKGETLADQLRDAGLSDVRFRRMTCGVVSLYWGRKQ